MKTVWDYTDLADAYLKRPPYSPQAIDKLFAKTSIHAGADVCDVGAGTAHLTLELVSRGCNVTAVEPNDAMRGHGIARTKGMPVVWQEGVGENTGQPALKFDLVTFGSSFNVTDRPAALKEASRILKPRGWFACMWNHRDLDDPLQQRIEDSIRNHIPDYDYGTRREDQTAVIKDSALFEDITMIEGMVSWQQSAADCVEAWRSHGTLHRQAGDKFSAIIADIEKVVSAAESAGIRIPYITRMWVARKIG